MDINHTYNVQQKDIYQDSFSGRVAEYPIHPLLLSRISGRQMTGDTITHQELYSLFEAARWSPSAFNIQPWRFIYARRNSTRFEQFLSTLHHGNQQWAVNSGALVVLLVPKYSVYNNKPQPLPSADFGAGAAYMSLALEANSRGLSATAIGGLNYGQLYNMLNVSQKSHTIECMIAVGQPVRRAPGIVYSVSKRKPINQFVFNDVYDNSDPDDGD